MKKTIILLTFLLINILAIGQTKPRIIIETDLGGDADDQATLVRYLLYSNEFDTEAIILTMTDKEFKRIQSDANLINLGFSKNPSGANSSYNMARHYIRAYGKSVNNLNRHSPNKPYPSGEHLEKNILKIGYHGRKDGENAIIKALRKNDSRKIWYTNWGTIDKTGAKTSLTRVLDDIKAGKVSGLKYEDVVKKINYVEYSNHNHLGPHKSKIAYYMDTFLQPGWSIGTRWADRWKILTGDQNYIKALGLRLSNYHTGPKEGDTMTWMHLIPNGINVPGEPELGSWSGRYTYEASVGGVQCKESDNWRGSTSRDNTLKRWGTSTSKSTDIINDFRARWQWAKQSSYNKANHAPIPKVKMTIGAKTLTSSGTTPLFDFITTGQTISLDASTSSDPDNNSLTYQWVVYKEITEAGLRNVTFSNANSSKTTLTIPNVNTEGYIHVYLRITDKVSGGKIPMTRYQRVILKTLGKPYTSKSMKLYNRENQIIPSKLVISRQSNTSYQVKVNVKETTPINKIEFYVNGVKTATDATAPYVFNLNTSRVGTYKVKARLWYDNNTKNVFSNESTITVKNLLIQSISKKSNKNYQIKQNFGKVKSYTDSSVKVTALPSYLNGEEYVMTADADKRSTTKDLLTLSLSAPAEVYIAYDRRLPRTPVWLRSFTDTREHVRYSNGVIMRLYKKRFNKGKVVLGGNESRQNNSSNYFVIVKKIPASIRISAPTTNSSFAVGANVPLRVVTNGSIAISGVEFYQNNAKLGEDRSAPYAFTIKNLKAGAHKIKARLKYKDHVGVSRALYSSEITIKAEVGSLISSITARSSKSYKAMKNFGKVQYFTDRNYKVTVYPSFLNRAEYVMTPNADKKSRTSNLLTLKLSAAADVYIAYDRRLPRTPVWLRSFTDTREHVRTSDGVIMRLYKKGFGAGNVVLGGNESRQDNSSNYFVIAKRRGNSKSAEFTINTIENQTEKIKVYPVPTTGLVTIDVKSQEAWSVITINGEVLKTGVGTSVDLSDLTSGVYFIKIKDQMLRVIKE